MNREAQPPIAELFGRYLQQQITAHEHNLAMPESLGEVVPYDAAPAQPIDPRLAWDEALAALRPFGDVRSCSAPADWPTLVVTHEPEMALAFAAGNYPQLVRNLIPLWRADNLAELRPASADSSSAPSLVSWAGETIRKQLYPQALLSIGALRLARQFEAATELTQRHESEIPAAWRAAWANEQAALAWHRGQAEEAQKLWQAQEATVPVLFNRGMAALFLGHPREARTALSQAVAQLPEDAAWHHLGRLYLALAEMK
jgi:tetratricopeptide (TPR) repeat protein